MLLLLLASNSWHAWFQGIISQLNHSQRPCRLSTIIPENKFHMWLGLLTKNLYPCFPPPNFDRLSCQGMKAHHPHPPPVLYIFSPAGTLNIVFHKSMLADLCSWMSSVSSKHSSPMSVSPSYFVVQLHHIQPLMGFPRRFSIIHTRVLQVYIRIKPY